MIIITGAAGFIGSCLTSYLNSKNYNNLVLVDDFSNPSKASNFKKNKYHKLIDRTHFLEWLENYSNQIEFVFHYGARTDTTETNITLLNKLNLNYSKYLFTLCAKYNIPIIYASSGATYGNGENGYNDDHEIIPKLKPLNPYGESKNDFDKWVLKKKNKPAFWAGLKFFNVYGPNEYHKGKMASVIFHAFNQIKKTKTVNLFSSSNPKYKNGEQLRDFVYVKDVLKISFLMMGNKSNSGIFNIGTGKARTFKDLAANTFHNMDIPVNIQYIPTPKNIRNNYQYFTQADTKKLFSVIDNSFNFFSLEDGIKDYVTNYLNLKRYF